MTGGTAPAAGARAPASAIERSTPTRRAPARTTGSETRPVPHPSSSTGPSLASASRCQNATSRRARSARSPSRRTARSVPAFRAAGAPARLTRRAGRRSRRASCSGFRRRRTRRSRRRGRIGRWPSGSRRRGGATLHPAPWRSRHEPRVRRESQNAGGGTPRCETDTGNRRTDTGSTSAAASSPGTSGPTAAAGDSPRTDDSPPKNRRLELERLHAALHRAEPVARRVVRLDDEDAAARPRDARDLARARPTGHECAAAPPRSKSSRTSRRQRAGGRRPRRHSRRAR